MRSPSRQNHILQTAFSRGGSGRTPTQCNVAIINSTQKQPAAVHHMTIDGMKVCALAEEKLTDSDPEASGSKGYPEEAHFEGHPRHHCGCGHCCLVSLRSCSGRPRCSSSQRVAACQVHCVTECKVYQMSSPDKFSTFCTVPSA